MCCRERFATKSVSCWFYRVPMDAWLFAYLLPPPLTHKRSDPDPLDAPISILSTWFLLFYNTTICFHPRASKASLNLWAIQATSWPDYGTTLFFVTWFYWLYRACFLRVFGISPNPYRKCRLSVECVFNFW